LKTRVAIASPPAAELIGNLLMATLSVEDHGVHFYDLHALTWADIVNGLKPDPKKVAGLSAILFQVGKEHTFLLRSGPEQDQSFCRQRTGHLGSWDHSAYKLPPKLNLIDGEL
jgi:hydrogenase large subunit